MSPRRKFLIIRNFLGRACSISLKQSFCYIWNVEACGSFAHWKQLSLVACLFVGQQSDNVLRLDPVSNTSFSYPWSPPPAINLWKDLTLLVAAYAHAGHFIPMDFAACCFHHLFTKLCRQGWSWDHFTFCGLCRQASAFVVLHSQGYPRPKKTEKWEPIILPFQTAPHIFFRTRVLTYE